MRSGRYRIKIATVMVAFSFILISCIAWSSLSSSNTRYPESSTITIRAETDEPTRMLGEVVQVKVYFINQKPEAFKTPFLDLGYEVLNSEGEVIYSIGATYGFPKESPFTLPAQSETLFSQTLKWPQLSFTNQNSTQITNNVTPGTYTIRVVVLAPFQATIETSVAIEG